MVILAWTHRRTRRWVRSYRAVPGIPRHKILRACGVGGRNVERRCGRGRMTGMIDIAIELILEAFAWVIGLITRIVMGVAYGIEWVIITGFRKLTGR